MLQLTNISKSFGTQSVLENVTLQVSPQSRVGLVGRNGCGKSTLLRIIMKEVEPDNGGSIYRTPGLMIGHLTQEPKITPGNTLEQEIKTVFENVNNAQDEEASLMANWESMTVEAQMAALQRLDELHQTQSQWDAQTIDAKIGKMVTGLGFTLEQLNHPVEKFSGGWQMRINLAKVLLQGADILLLDEPTNHLDLEACEWLEGFLKSYAGGLIIVSHDRRFLDQVVTEIAEVELGRLTVWTGNYTRFLEQKAEMLERLTSAADRQQKELAKQMVFVERFRASATKSTQAKSREKQLAKIERIEAPQINTQRLTVSFPVPQTSGKQVLTIRNLAKSFGKHRLFKKVDADLERQQRVFLLGANGCGKTTLLRLILGIEPADEGTCEFGYNTVCGYFSQNQLQTLNPDSNAFDTLHDACPKMTQTEIRGVLGRFLFKGDQAFKSISLLSGGEKSRVALAKLMLSAPNLLLLDEPTNHMDIPAQEVLEEAFREYQGTILCISHDRYFIQQLATDIWELYEGQLLKYTGNYDYYLSKREEIRALYSKQAASQKTAGKTVSSSSGKDRASASLNPKKEGQKRLTQLEKAIVAMEEELALLHEALSAPDVQQNYQAMETLGRQIEEKETTLLGLNTEWTVLAEEMGSLV